MSPFWHNAREERGRLVRTLHELGPTTVPGLSAALSWSEKRTERLVRELASSGEGGIVYSPAGRRVEIPSSPASPASGGPNQPAGPTAPGPATASLPSPSPTAVVGAKWGGSMICSHCSATMEPTAHGEALVCRECGHISGMPRSSRAPAPSTPSGVGAPSAGPTAPVPDRRQQELFAAYVSSRPILCPKCKTPLRHRGLGLYGCPACGQVVRFNAPDSRFSARG